MALRAALAGVGVFFLVVIAATVGGIQTSTSAIAAACGSKEALPAAAPGVKGKYKQKQIEALWIAMGGPKSQATIAGAVGMAESGGDPNIANSIGATGLWQILLSAHPDVSAAQARDPEFATKYAIKLWRDQGWQPWEAYTGPDGLGADGIYLQFMPKHKLAPNSIPNPSSLTNPAPNPLDVANPIPGVDCTLTASGGKLKGKGVQVAWRGGPWPVALPGFPGESCDPRIIPDVLAIVKAYKAFVSDCYAASGHAAAGEHPLGLATDLSPDVRKGGTWDDLDRLARDMGWRTACASTGCAGQTGTIMRFVGWDGYPNHGRGNHLHLSWNHGPGRPAQSVAVLNPPT